MIEQPYAFSDRREKRLTLRPGLQWPISPVACIFVAIVALFLGRMIAQGRAGLVAVAALLLPSVLFIAARPLRCVVLGVTAIVILPSTLSLGTAQASVPRVAAIAVVAPFLLDRRKGAGVSLNVVDLAVVGIMVAVLSSWAFGPHEPHSFRAVLNYLVPLAFYGAARQYGMAHGRLFLWVLLVSGALASLTVWFEALFWHRPLFVDPNNYSWIGGGKFIFRPAGVFGTPPGASAELAMISISGLPLFGSTSGARRVGVSLCLAVSIGALLLTFTRGGMIAFAIGLTLYAAFLGSASTVKIVYGGMILLLIGIVLVLPRVSAAGWYQKGVLRGGAFTGRQTYWANAWPVIANSPKHLIVGHGINSLLVGTQLPGQQAPDIAASPTLGTLSPHNQYIRTLVEQGVLGLTLLGLWLGGAIVKGSISVWRSGPMRRSIAAATAATAAFAVISFVDDTLRHPPGFAVVALLTGLLVTWTGTRSAGGRAGALPQTER